MQDETQRPVVAEEAVERVQRPVSSAPVKQETEIDLMEVFNLLIEHAWQIILCLVVGAVVAFVYTYFFVTPQYTSRAKMYVVSASNNSVLNLSDLQVGSQLTSDYREIMKSRPVLEKVISDLGLPFSTGALSAKVSVTNPNGTRILYVTVTDTDPDRACQIANIMAEEGAAFLAQTISAGEGKEPKVYEKAVVSKSPSSPSYSRNVILGGLVGVVLICAILVIRMMMNDTIVTAEDVKRYLGMDALATIPEDGSEHGRRGYGYGYGYGYGRNRSKKQNDGKGEA